MFIKKYLFNFLEIILMKMLFIRKIQLLNIIHVQETSTKKMNVLLLFNDGHVLQLWSETVALRRRMIYGLDHVDGHMITKDECDSDFLKFVLWLMENPGKNLNQEIDSPGD